VHRPRGAKRGCPFTTSGRWTGHFLRAARESRNSRRPVVRALWPRSHRGTPQAIGRARSGSFQHQPRRPHAGISIHEIIRRVVRLFARPGRVRPHASPADQLASPPAPAPSEDAKRGIVQVTVDVPASMTPRAGVSRERVLRSTMCLRPTRRWRRPGKIETLGCSPAHQC